MNILSRVTSQQIMRQKVISHKNVVHASNARIKCILFLSWHASFHKRRRPASFYCVTYYWCQLEISPFMHSSKEATVSKKIGVSDNFLLKLWLFQQNITPVIRYEGKTCEERNLVIFKILLWIAISKDSSRRYLSIDKVVLGLSSKSNQNSLCLCFNFIYSRQV